MVQIPSVRICHLIFTRACIAGGEHGTCLYFKNKDMKMTNNDRTQSVAVCTILSIKSQLSQNIYPLLQDQSSATPPQTAIGIMSSPSLEENMCAIIVRLIPLTWDLIAWRIGGPSLSYTCRKNKVISRPPQEEQFSPSHCPNPQQTTRMKGEEKAISPMSKVPV